VLCNRVKFENLRRLLDDYLSKGEVSVTNQEDLPAEFWRKTHALLAELGRVAAGIALKKIVEWLAKIMFPDLPPIDP